MLVALRTRRAFAEVPIESVRKCFRGRVPVDRGVDARPEPRARREHAAHLAQRRPPIREELQAERTGPPSQPPPPQRPPHPPPPPAIRARAAPPARPAACPGPRPRRLPVRAPQRAPLPLARPRRCHTQHQGLAGPPPSRPARRVQAPTAASPAGRRSARSPPPRHPPAAAARAPPCRPTRRDRLRHHPDPSTRRRPGRAPPL